MVRSWILRVAVAAFAVLATAAQAQDFLREPLRIPMAAAGPRGLEALLVRPSAPGRYPLALISHGSPRSSDDRPDMTPLALLPQATEFARRGWAAVVVMRRGYAGSGGSWAEGYGGCRNPDYLPAAAASVADLRAAISFVSRRPDVDAGRILAVGQSAGGFATVALTAEQVPGLVAGINFAGGKGSLQPDTVCREDRLIDAFRALGSKSRVPMLWIYSENDHFFGPALAEKLRAAFVRAGGKLTFIKAPAFRDDGHRLFSPPGIPVWTPFVDRFLKDQNLVLRRDLLPVPRPNLQPPRQLSAEGRQAFSDYLASGPHKAFAVSPEGHFGWRSGRRSAAKARAEALATCRERAGSCRVAVVDDAAVP